MQLHPQKQRYSVYHERHLVAKQIQAIYWHYSAPILHCNKIISCFHIITAHLADFYYLF